MNNFEGLRERNPYQRDIYQELERIEQRGKRKKEQRKQKRASMLKFLGWKTESTTNIA